MKLSTRQYWVSGRETNGRPAVMFIRQDVPNKVHLQINGEHIHVDQEQLLKVLADMFPVQGKHGADNE